MHCNALYHTGKFITATAGSGEVLQTWGVTTFYLVVICFLTFPAMFFFSHSIIILNTPDQWSQDNNLYPRLRPVSTCIAKGSLRARSWNPSQTFKPFSTPSSPPRPSYPQCPLPGLSLCIHRRRRTRWQQEWLSAGWGKFLYKVRPHPPASRCCGARPTWRV